MVRLAVLLGDAEAAQLGFQGVAAAPAAGEAGSEHQPVVRERGGGSAVGGDRSAERGQDRRAGDPGVGGERENIAGVVVQPGHLALFGLICARGFAGRLVEAVGVLVHVAGV
jgi:hypothetical protein